MTAKTRLKRVDWYDSGALPSIIRATTARRIERQLRTYPTDTVLKILRVDIRGWTRIAREYAERAAAQRRAT